MATKTSNLDKARETFKNKCHISDSPNKPHYMPTHSLGLQGTDSATGIATLNIDSI